MQIQISWLLQKPTDLDLHCLQMQSISGFSRTRVKIISLGAVDVTVPISLALNLRSTDSRYVGRSSIQEWVSGKYRIRPNYHNASISAQSSKFYSQHNFCLLLYKGKCCGYSFELHQLDAIQMSTHNICLIKKIRIKEKTQKHCIRIIR